MYTRLYKLLVTVPPLAWVAVFLIAPYLFLFCFSFWSVQSQTIVHHWNLNNYRQLVRSPVYVQVLLRSMRIAGMVTVLSLALSFPLAYYVSFRAHARKELLYQLVIIPLWVSYLVRAYAWKTILGSDGVLNTLLQYTGVVQHPVEFLLYSPFAVVLTLGDFLAPLLLGGPGGIMISNVVVSLFGAAYDWPLGAAISLSMLIFVVLLLMTTERLEKRWSFR